MAHYRKHHRRRHNEPGRRRFHRRHNPLGITGGIVKDAAYVAAGAVGAAALPGMVAPTYDKGWPGVLSSGLAAVAVSFVAKLVGGPTGGTEALKGGLAITVLKALNTAGIKTPGLGLYGPSYFAVPTSSDQYLRTRSPVAFIPAPAKTVAGMGYHRFRSRYAGNYGG